MARNGIAQGIKHIVELGNAAEEQISEKAKSAGTAAVGGSDKECEGRFSASI